MGGGEAKVEGRPQEAAEKSRALYASKRGRVEPQIERQIFPAIRKPSGLFKSPSSYICIGTARLLYCTSCTREAPRVRRPAPLREALRGLPPDRDALAAADCLESKARTSVRRCRLSSRQGAEVVEGSVEADEASLQVILLGASLFPVKKACPTVGNVQIARREAQRKREGECGY